MMSELIRMSLFCDRTDAIVGDISNTRTVVGDINHTQTGVGDINHTQTVVGDINHTQTGVGDINHTQTVVGDITHTQTVEPPLTPVESSRTRDTEDCLPPANSRMSEQDQIHELDTRLSEPEMTLCSGSAHNSQSLVCHFIRSTAGAPVSLGTFSTCQPEHVFENHYLQCIVQSHKETNEKVEQHNEVEDVEGEQEIVCPPYSYVSLAAAAIILSGKKTLKRSEIKESIYNMFEVFRIQNPKWQKCWRTSVLKNSYKIKILFNEGDAYGVNYDNLNLKTFQKRFAYRTNSHLYADDLFTQLGHPDKLELLPVPNKPKVKRVVKKRKPEDVQQSRPEGKVTTKKMKLPPRPCFNDESSSDSLQMKPVSTTPYVLTPAPCLNLQLNTPVFAPTNMVYFLQRSSFGSYATVPVINNAFVYNS